MMAGSMARSKSKAGYIDARPHIRQLDEVLLQRTAGVKLRPSAVSASSRLYLKEQTSPGDARSPRRMGLEVDGVRHLKALSHVHPNPQPCIRFCALASHR